MDLYAALQNAKSEEDVKDAYIRALGLKSYTEGLIDIRTDDIWFEAKNKPQSVYKMFTQLLHYVKVAYDSDQRTPPFLAVIDTAKAAILSTDDILPLLKDKTIKWGKSASNFDQETVEKVSTYIGTHFVSFKIDTHEQEFIETVKLAIKSGKVVRTQITPDNLKQVFDKWVDLIGREIDEVKEADYALLFFADIMHDGKMSTHEKLPAKLLHDGEKPVFLLNGVFHQLGSFEGYRQFWLIYHKPPKEKYRNYLLERRDSLIPIEDRSFKGAFYTPLNVVDKAYDLLAETLGKNWQENYIVWDMCCGVGNLEVKHSNHRKIFMSTLDQADIDVMSASKTCVAASKFQYDYLNDDITDDGAIDYSLTNKMPQELRQAIHDGKKLLILINPPYAESGSGIGDGNKQGVAKSKFANTAMSAYGKASNELFTQFVARIAQEVPSATIAMFSKLKYVNAPNFEKFRSVWNAKYQGGFIVHSKSFEGLKGNFPIGFLIWTTRPQSDKKTSISEVFVEVLDKRAAAIGDKSFYNLPNETFLSRWLERPKVNETKVVALKNAVSPSTTKPVNTWWSDDAIGYMLCDSNDIQHAGQTALFSSVYRVGHDGGFYVNKENLWQAAVIFAVRRLIKATWINDRDQFLQPTCQLTDEFKNDCLIWMLFNGSNLTASANDLNWNGGTWSITNHFIPFTENEVGANLRFTSCFMVDYLRNKNLSVESKSVLNEGRKLWKTYFTTKTSDNHKTRNELKLIETDVGWYQIRKAFERRETNDGSESVDFSAFKAAYDALSSKLRPMVYDLGFMRL